MLVVGREVGTGEEGEDGEDGETRSGWGARGE